jgi:hypothetical protein
MLEAAASSTLFPCEMVLVFNAILPASWVFQGGDRLSL